MSATLSSWLVPGSRLWLDLTSCLLVGELLLATWLLPAPAGVLSERSRGVLRRSAGWALLWAVGAVALAVSSTAALVDVPVTEVFSAPSVGRIAWQLPQVRALALIGLAGVGVALLAPRVTRTLTGRALLPLVLLALSTLTVTGHASSSSNHFWAAQSVLVHVAAVTLWLGGLVSLVLHGRDRALLAVALPAYSRVAFGCFAVVAVSGIVGAYVRLGFAPTLWLSTYGALLVAKTAVLLAVGVLGAVHRRVTLLRVQRGTTGAFRRLALGEVAVMTLGVVLGVVLARTPPPTGALKRIAPPHSENFPTVDRMLLAPGWRLLWETRANALTVAVVVVLALAYLAGARTLVARGGTWSGRRTAAFLAGVLLTLWGLAGSLAAYSAATLSLNAAQTIVLAVVAPALLALGAPYTLLAALRPGVAPRRTQALRNPVNSLVGLVLLVGSLYGTSLLETSFHSPRLHAALALASLALGLLFFCGVLGPDATVGAEDARMLLLVLALALGVFAAHVLTRTSLIAGTWYTDLALFWGDPAAAQARAGWLLAGCAAGLTVLAVRATSPRTAARTAGQPPARTVASEAEVPASEALASR